MLSIHYVSVMMWIFYIDLQQNWKCDWTMNIGANRNAHGKRTVSTKQPQVTDLTVVLLDIGEVLSLFSRVGVGDGGGCSQLHCIYYLVLYTDLKAAEGF